MLVRGFYVVQRKDRVHDRPHFAPDDGRHDRGGETLRRRGFLSWRAQAIADAEKVEPSGSERVHVELDLGRARHLPDGRVTAVNSEAKEDVAKERRTDGI